MNIETYIEKAIAERKSITIKYIKYGGEISVRELSDLKYSDEFGNAYIEGFCHLRHERRTFKISRIKEVDGIASNNTDNISVRKIKHAYSPFNSHVFFEDSVQSNQMPPIKNNGQNNISLSSEGTRKKQIASKSNNAKKTEGCYIATMAYGDYNHPKVMVLRRFRDAKLKKSFCGRIFIYFYYAISPKLVKILKDNNKINSFIRRILDFFVSKIKE